MSISSFRLQYLKKRFEKYGEIESTKVLSSKLEGFVTFKCDRHACLAYDWEKDKCKDKRVRVDSTWHQPDGRIRIDSEWNTYEYDDDDDIWESDDSSELDNSAVETMDAEFSSPLLLLNDDSLFALFDRCDSLSLVNLSKTCKRLENLLKCGNYYFPNHKSFHKKYEDKWSLIDLENIFKLMGRHFDKLDVWFHDESSDTVLRYAQIIGKYCHDGNVKDVCLVTSWINDVWLELRPALKYLSKLQVHVNYYNEEEVTADLSELCPNLDTLSLTDSFIVGKSLTRTIPSLQTFIFAYSWCDLVKLDSFEFFYANRQLKLFECVKFNFDNVALLLHLLPNIDTLRLFNPLDLEFANHILGLQNFQNLRNLKLRCFRDYGFDKAQIIDCCGQLKNLLELKLYFFKMIDEKEPVGNLSKSFAHLERLQLAGVYLDERSVLDYVRTASKIKVMHFHKCDVYATDSLIAGLRDIMAKSSQRYRSECSLFVDDKVNHHNCIAINNQEIKSVAWVCKHRI